jgi:ATP-dependent RNA helicase SUPV3L1/SUV3
MQQPAAMPTEVPAPPNPQPAQPPPGVPPSGPPEIHPPPDNPAQPAKPVEAPPSQPPPEIPSNTQSPNRQVLGASFPYPSSVQPCAPTSGTKRTGASSSVSYNASLTRVIF